MLLLVGRRLSEKAPRLLWLLGLSLLRLPKEAAAKGLGLPKEGHGGGEVWSVGLVCEVRYGWARSRRELCLGRIASVVRD